MGLQFCSVSEFYLMWITCPNIDPIFHIFRGR
jgi:hypothetical protein